MPSSALHRTGQTGAEALYADMGHFGRKPIARAWFLLVLPALVLNFTSARSGCILSNAEAARNPFYLLAPGWALAAEVALSTATPVIASQAVISEPFSPDPPGDPARLRAADDPIQHTSSHEKGRSTSAG
ncbi:KUP/HAK/KT family potassium transporter [Pseudomonas aeruginosa]